MQVNLQELARKLSLKSQLSLQREEIIKTANQILSRDSDIGLDGKYLPLDISQSQAYKVAIILQGYSVFDFTNDEILYLASLDLSNIERTSIPYKKRLDPQKHILFDTGSAYIYYELDEVIANVVTIDSLQNPQELL